MDSTVLRLNEQQKKLLSLLADGQFHSGTELALNLGITRAAVWKHLHSLTDLELELISLAGKGYRLARPLELLSVEKINLDLNQPTKGLISELEIYPRIHSTNNYLLERSLITTASGLVCLAESQSAGKGRRGKQWLSPFGSNIYLSILWRFHNDPSSLAGLSLVIGVAVIRTLRELGISDSRLKWPNDIYWQNKKLSGILIEVSGEASGCSTAVIGLGLNLHLSAEITREINQPCTDLEQILGQQNYSRNNIVARLLNHLMPVIADFETETLARYLDEWRSYDALQNKAATVYIGTQQFDGVVQGIDHHGMLLLKNNMGEIKTFASGEVSLRPVL